jgi:hypothetical protein
MTKFFTSYSSQDHLVAKKASINAMIEVSNAYLEQVTKSYKEEEEESNDFENFNGVEAYEAITAYENRKRVKAEQGKEKHDLLEKQQEFIEAIKLANKANQSSKTIVEATSKFKSYVNKVLNKQAGGVDELNAANTSLNETLERLSDIEVIDDNNLIKKCAVLAGALLVSGIILALVTAMPIMILPAIFVAPLLAQAAYISLSKGYSETGMAKWTDLIPPISSERLNNGQMMYQSDLYDKNCRTTVQEDALSEEELDDKIQFLRA